MRVTFFANLSARDKSEFDWSWPDIVQFLRDEPPEAQLKCRLPLIKLAVFGDARSDMDSLRHDANVLTVTGVEGDYDGGEMTIDEAAERLRGAGVRALLYTSPSHVEASPRWRVLAPLERECDPSERHEYVRALNGVLGGVLSRESFTLSQAFYCGRIEGREYHVIEVS